MTTEPRKSERQDLDEYLTGQTPVSQEYANLGAEQPPTEIDALILDEAEREAKVRVFPLTGSSRRWMAPAALAATVLLSFSLVMSVVIESSKEIDDELTFPVSSPEKPAGNGIEELVLTTRSLDRDNKDVGRTEPDREIAASRVFESGRIADDARLEEMMAAPAEVQPEMKSTPEENMPMAMAPRKAAIMTLDGAMETVRSYLAAAREQELAKVDERAEYDDQLGESEGIDVIVPTVRVPAQEERAPARSEGIGEIVVTSRTRGEGIYPMSWLEEILEVYDAGEIEIAADGLERFRQTFPDHPVSVELSANEF